MFGAEMQELDFNSLVTVNTSALSQRPGNWGNRRKTRLMSAHGGGEWLCYFLAIHGLQRGPRLGCGKAWAEVGVWGEQLPSCDQKVKKTKELFSSFPPACEQPCLSVPSRSR